MFGIFISRQRGAICALALVGLLLSGTSCRVRRVRQVVATEVATSNSDRAAAVRLATLATDLSAPIASREGWQSLKATGRGRIDLGAGRSFSSRISLTAQRGVGLRLSVQPFPLIEAARLWFTPSGIVLVDLINSVYTETSYAALGERLGFTPTYDQIESLILGQIFTPNGEPLEQMLGALTARPLPDGRLALTAKDARGGYEAVLAEHTRQLLGFVVHDTSGGVRFSSEYIGVQPLAGRTILPERTVLRAFGKQEGRPTALGSLELEFHKVGEGSADPSAVAPLIKPQYERLSLDAVLKVLDKL